MGLWRKLTEGAHPKRAAFEILAIRKLADKSHGERVKKYDEETGEPYLYNPANGQRENWPLAGIKFENGVPSYTAVSTSFVANGISEGWIIPENESPVHRPGGPADDQWKITHTFRHFSHLTFVTVDGDYRYRVTRQPDKYVVNDLTAKVSDQIYADGDTEVFWSYELAREA